MLIKSRVAIVISLWIFGCVQLPSISQNNAQDDRWKELEIHRRDRILDRINISIHSSNKWSGWSLGYLADDDGVVFDVSMHAIKNGLRCGDKITSFNLKETELERKNHRLATAWIENNCDPEQGLNLTVLRGDQEYEVFLPAINYQDDLMVIESLVRELNWLELTKLN